MDYKVRLNTPKIYLTIPDILEDRKNDFFTFSEEILAINQKTKLIMSEANKMPSNKETDKYTIQLVNEYLLRHTVQLFYKTDKGLRPYGSGVLVEIGDVYFIFTASHVANHLENEKLFIRVNLSSYVEIIGHLRYSSEKESNGIDVAYIKLPDILVTELQKSYTFMPKEKLESHKLQLKTMNYCVLGFPERNIEKVDGRMETGASYILTHASNDNPYKYYKKNKKDYFFVDLSGKGTDIVTSEQLKLDPNLHGISGGGLWYLDYYYDENTGYFGIDYKLIAIITQGYKGKYYCLMANRVDLIINALVTHKDVSIFEIQEFFKEPTN